MEKDVEADEFDALDDVETLPCNLAYVMVCILMPILNGALSGFMWPGYSLHFVDMDWPLVMAGWKMDHSEWPGIECGNPTGWCPIVS